MNIRVLVSLPALVLTLAAGLPAALVMGWIISGEPGVLKLAASRVERFLAFFLMCAAIFAYFLGKRDRKFSPVFLTKPARAEFPLLALPLFPLGAYAFLTFFQAREALYLPDLDYTGMSSALNETARGFGLLITPYFHTGSSGSYLGHHFSPALLLLVPFYRATGLGGEWLSHFAAGDFRPDHGLYGILLGLFLAWGLYLWGRLAFQELNSRLLLLGALAGFALSYPLWRLVLSFHFEVLVLPFSALTFLGWKRRRAWLFWVGLFLWIMVKEDTAVYAAFFLLPGLLDRERRNLAVLGLVVCVAYFLMSNLFLRHFFAGDAAPEWNYWKGASLSNFRFRSLADLLLACGLLPLLRPAFFFGAILPLLILQSLSGHAWHASFYGHYSYTVLPLLLYGTLEGWKRLRGARAIPLTLLVLGLIAYSAAGDRETPLPFPGDSRYGRVRELARAVPPGACVRVQTTFSALIPLDARVLPLKGFANNPFPDGFGPFPAKSREGGGARERIADQLRSCRGVYLLLDTVDYAPYHAKKDMDVLLQEAKRSGKVAAQSGSLRLYRFSGARSGRDGKSDGKSDVRSDGRSDGRSGKKRL